MQQEMFRKEEETLFNIENAIHLDPVDYFQFVPSGAVRMERS